MSPSTDSGCRVDKRVENGGRHKIDEHTSSRQQCSLTGTSAIRPVRFYPLSSATLVSSASLYGAGYAVDEEGRVLVRFGVVSRQQVVAEVVVGVAPDGVDVIAARLRVLELDQERRAL
jgi:hypothetical protein